MNKTVLITGSNKGIGFETARQCGKIGWQVIISGRNETKLKNALSKLQEEKINAESLLMDVSDENSIKKAALEFASKKIKLDVLINNAAILLKEDQQISQTQSVIEQTINTNCYGPLRVTKSFLPFLNSLGRVIMISSGGGSMTDEVAGWSPAYCSSKSFLNAITRQMAHELRANHISVNAVCPGWVRSDMGGAGASRSLEKGAETPVWLATAADQKLTGKFFRDKKEIPW